MGLFLGFIILPIAAVVAVSFSSSSFIVFPIPGFTLRWSVRCCSRSLLPPAPRSPTPLPRFGTKPSTGYTTSRASKATRWSRIWPICATPGSRSRSRSPSNRTGARRRHAGGRIRLPSAACRDLRLRRRDGGRATRQPPFGDARAPQSRPTSRSKPASPGLATPERDVEIWQDGGLHRVPLYLRENLQHGHRFSGPAIIAQEDTTVCIPAGFEASVDRLGNLHLTATTA